MHTKIFILTLLFLLALLPIRGSAQCPHLTRAAQKKLNATFLREGPWASATRLKEFLAQGAALDCADEQGATVLMKAVSDEEDDRTDHVKTLIDLHAKVNARDKSGRTPLFYAFMGSDQYRPTPKLVTTLLDAGADINAVSKYGETPLKMALAMEHEGTFTVRRFLEGGGAREGTKGNYFIADSLVKTLTTDKAALVTLLKQRGARDGLAEAAFSGDAATIHKLLQQGADIHNVAVTSALETAIRIGDTDVMKLLLAAGANPSARDRKGMSLLMQAVGEGRYGPVQALVDAGADVNARDHTGLRTLVLVHGDEAPLILKLLLERGAIDDGTALRHLAGERWFESVDRGGDTFRPARTVKVALQGFMLNNDWYERAISRYQDHNSEELDAQLIQLLLEAGVDVNAPSANGTTALMIAATGHQMLKTKTLLAFGADINRPNNQGWTALTGALINGRSSEIVQYLLKEGAQIGLAEALLSDDFPRARTLLTADCPIAMRDYFGMSSLMLAAEKGQADIVRMLLERGADVNAQDSMRGSTALMYAVLGEGSQTPSGHMEWSGTLDMDARTKIVSMLLDHHADPNLNPYFFHGRRYFRNPETTDIELTALAYAQEVKNVAAVDLLIRHGAKPHAPVAPVMPAKARRTAPGG